MISRRHCLTIGLAATGALALPALAWPVRAAAESSGPTLSDDGLYIETWFLNSFLDLSEDLGDAAEHGKRYAVMWEQKGCPYCRETHLVNLQQPEIKTFVSENFDILQLNLFGSRRVTDFDGEEMEERELARKYGIAFTPTIQFFPDTPDQAAGKSGKEIEVARMPGYLRPPHFLAMFRFVKDKAYERTTFRRYLKEIS
jgi:thioredoxin-related protein